jgi:hypothetical protein
LSTQGIDMIRVTSGNLETDFVSGHGAPIVAYRSYFCKVNLLLTRREAPHNASIE